MPRGRGGQRQGTPGKAYTNRTDLATDYAPSSAENTPASGGVHPVNTPQVPMTYPEQVPKLDDPTARPMEPLMAPGMPTGGGDDVISDLRAAYAQNPTPELRRALRIYYARFGR
jgi:hypothetical protein